MSEKIILIREGWRESLIKDIGTFSTFAGLIGFGVILESAAMQWTGAAMGWVSIFTWAARTWNDNRVTLDEAAKRIEEWRA